MKNLKSFSSLNDLKALSYSENTFSTLLFTWLSFNAPPSLLIEL